MPDVSFILPIYATDGQGLDMTKPEGNDDASDHCANKHFIENWKQTGRREAKKKREEVQQRAKNT